MAGILRVLAVAMVAMAAGSTALAQTRPIVTSLGPDFPKAEMFIGNSFFYYNNGLPGHASQMEMAVDPEHKQDYRAIMVTLGGCRVHWPCRADCYPPQS